MSKIKAVIFDYDGIIVERNFTYECFQKFNTLKIFKKITNLALKAYIEGKFHPPINSLAYSFFLYCLKGTRADEIENYVKRTTYFYLVPGIESVIKNLKEKGIKVGIVSENIQFQPRKAAELLGVDFVCSNEVEVKDGKITGKISRFSRKSEMIKEICKQFSISNDEMVYIGDDADPLGKVRKCVLLDPRRRKDEKKVDNENCLLIKDLYQLISLL